MYHEKQIASYKAIAINYNWFAINHSHKLLQNNDFIKKGVPQNAKISKPEIIFSKSPSQLRIAGEHLLWGTARGGTLHRLLIGNISYDMSSNLVAFFMIL